MNKKTAITLGGIVLIVAVLSISTVMFFRYWNAPMAVEAVAAEDISQKEESSAPISTPPIKVEPKAVIEESTVSKPEDNLPPPAVSETSDPDGGVIQTPNWETQKELAPGTDLENPDKQPEYVKPAQLQTASSKPTAPASSSSKAEFSAASSKQSNTPKNGDTKTINGEKHTYVTGFGWVKNGDGGTTEYIDAPTTGNKVGH